VSAWLRYKRTPQHAAAAAGCVRTLEMAASPGTERALLAGVLELFMRGEAQARRPWLHTTLPGGGPACGFQGPFSNRCWNVKDCNWNPLLNVKDRIWNPLLNEGPHLKSLLNVKDRIWNPLLNVKLPVEAATSRRRALLGSRGGRAAGHAGGALPGALITTRPLSCKGPTETPIEL
jgi:hypothetical protein